VTPDTAKLQLRDIHLPEPISWWPPAPGWWLSAALIILLLAGTVLVLTVRRRTRLKRTARAELLRISSNYQQHHDDGRTVRELSTLLRRVSISLDRREQAASLTGDAWLQHLDQLSGGEQFSSGAGKMLTDAPYRQRAEVSAAELLELCQRWLHDIPSSTRR
jgi:hypothetical protein